MDVQKTFLGGAVALFILVSLLMMAPFLTYLLTALILAFVLRPLQNYLEPYFGETLSSFLIITSFMVVAVLPFVLAVGTVSTDALELVDNIEEVESVNFTQFEHQVFELTGHEVDIQDELQGLLERFTSVAVGGVVQVIGVLTSLAIGLFIMLFSLFYFLKDGEKLYNWIRSVTPVSDEIQNQLYKRAEVMTDAVLKGHVLVALFEGLVGGFGLYLAGVPNFAFWTFMMIIFCIIPIVGAFVVWIPAGIYLILMQRPFAGIFLLLYGAIIVSIIDNLMRPYLVDRKAQLSPAAILIGVVGGLYLFGVIGLFIGPVIFGLTKTIAEVFNQHYEDL